MLVVMGSHADDAEFGAGGMIAKSSAAGEKAIIIHFGIIKKEEGKAKAKRAAEILGAEAMFFTTGHPAEVTIEATNILREALDKFRPAKFIVQWPIDMHPHHGATGFLAMRAVLHEEGGGNFKLLDGDELWFYELNTGIASRNFHPDVYVDITEYAGKKYAALGCYMGADGNSAEGIKKWGFWSEQQILLEKFRGFESGFERAEAFAVFNGWKELPMDKRKGYELRIEGIKPNWYTVKGIPTKTTELRLIR